MHTTLLSEDRLRALLLAAVQKWLCPLAGHPALLRLVENVSAALSPLGVLAWARDLGQALGIEALCHGGVVGDDGASATAPPPASLQTLLVSLSLMSLPLLLLLFTAYRRLMRYVCGCALVQPVVCLPVCLPVHLPACLPISQSFTQ